MTIDKINQSKHQQNQNQQQSHNNQEQVPLPPPIPVTLLSGFLGSGKTSLLKHILHNKQGLRVAVIVNEITDENIDAYALGGTTLLQHEEKLVEMSNGCICCTLRTDLINQLRELASCTNHATSECSSNDGDRHLLRRRFDYILIESSGISEPMQVAQTFYVDIGDGQGSLNNACTRLDTCVTVVDASNILARLQEGKGKVKEISASGGGAPHGHRHHHHRSPHPDPDSVGDGDVSNQVDAAKDVEHYHQGQGQEDEDDDDDTGIVDDDKEQSIGQLTLDQLEFANVIIVNKIDKLSSQQELETLLSTMKQINPLAEVISAQHGVIPSLTSILGTGRCNLEFAESVMGWMTEPPESHVPETEEYGIRNLVFRSDKPFHPLRLHTWLNSLWNVEESGSDDDDDDDDKDDDDDNDDDVIPQMTSRKQKAQPSVDIRKNRREWYGGEIFRIKGFAWLGNPSRVYHFVALSGAGDSLVLQVGGDWMNFPERSGSGTIEMEPCQRLAFLGQNIDKAKLVLDLEGLLLTDDEHQRLKDAINNNDGVFPDKDLFDDPFLPWDFEDDEDDDEEEAEEEEEEEEDDEQSHDLRTHSTFSKKAKKELDAGKPALKKSTLSK